MKELNRITENDETVEREGDILSVRKTKTVIEILLSHYHEIPHEQIRDELVTILIGKCVMVITILWQILRFYNSISNYTFNKILADVFYRYFPIKIFYLFFFFLIMDWKYIHGTIKADYYF